MKKVYIKTFGCQMNTRDSEVICGLLKNEGYKISDDAQSADVILLNTCSVRQHAEDRVWSEIGRYRKTPACRQAGKTENRKPIIGVIGCMAQNYKEGVFQKAPGVDFAVGTGDIHKIPEIIKKVLRGQSPKGRDSPLFQLKIWETDGGVRPDEIYHTGFYEDKEHAFIVISEGCSNFCSYCVVPYVRGQPQSRNYKNILREIEEAVDNGITQITLLGQNVNAYRYSDINFVQLIKLVNLIKGLKSFSFVTSHPKDASLELFRAMQESGKIKKHLHLPLQSGSDRILEMMNRGYTRKFYLGLVENYRKIVKGAALTTDIIVGFPTETEVDFQYTRGIVKDIEANAAYIFKYSARPRTEAARLPDDVTKEEKKRRHSLILELQKKISKALNSNDKIQNPK